MADMTDSTITTDDVAHLADLSMLRLSSEVTEKLQGDLKVILGYVDQLSTLNTDGVEPTYQVGVLHNVWREDTVAEKTVTRDALLELAPDSQDNQIKVPKVL